MTAPEIGRDAATFVGLLAIGWVLATAFAKPSLAPPSTVVPCHCACSVSLPSPVLLAPAASQGTP
jgi:hypothetical protein